LEKENYFLSTLNSPIVAVRETTAAYMIVEGARRYAYSDLRGHVRCVYEDENGIKDEEKRRQLSDQLCAWDPRRGGNTATKE
jgi:hypothetical protein